MDNSELAAALRAILGLDGVLDRPHDIDGYRGDLACAASDANLIVARPRTTEDVSAVVKVCAASGVPITPRGGGTGLAGGATPGGAGPTVVVSFERMRRVRAVDLVNEVMIVEAGCTLREAQEAAETAGRMLGLDHGGAGSSQIGGNLATNSGGNNVLRYGMAGDQVLGLEVVLADGRIVSRLSPLRKNNIGTDLKRLFVGSEGTLGLMTVAALRLRPAPVARATACVGVSSPEGALEFFGRARIALGETISACELMSRVAVELHFRHRGEGRPPLATEPQWLLLIEADSASRFFDLDGAFQALLEEAMEAGIATDGTVAASEAQRDGLWAIREGIAIAMIETPGGLKSDTAVPIGAIPEFIALAGAAVAALVPGCQPAPFGHIGDGNIHFNVLPPPDMAGEDFRAHWTELSALINDVSLQLGGTISAEHGIGLTKREALQGMLTPAEYDLMRAVKTALDPQGIFNPGKILIGGKDHIA